MADPVALSQDLVIPATLLPELREVLGLMVFKTAPLAHIFRAAGSDIPCKVEAEQAFILHWLLTLVQQHGPVWRATSFVEIDRLMAEIQARQADPPTEGVEAKPDDREEGP